MTRHTITTLQPMRECRWSQPQFCLPVERDERLWDVPWECTRTPGHERHVDEVECADCGHWEADRTS
jgi:hypothetical protein